MWSAVLSVYHPQWDKEIKVHVVTERMEVTELKHSHTLPSFPTTMLFTMGTQPLPVFNALLAGCYISHSSLGGFSR